MSDFQKNPVLDADRLRRDRRLLPRARAGACRTPEDQACNEYSAAHTAGSLVGKERCPRSRQAAELSRPFCESYRVVTHHRRATMGPCADAESPPLFPPFRGINRRQLNLSFLTLCRQLAPLAVRCERRRQASNVRSDPSGSMTRKRPRANGAPQTVGSSRTRRAPSKLVLLRAPSRRSG
jgi:hypothetical protein